MKQTDIRKTGYQALINALGVVGMLRFLRQLDIGSGNYTQERQQSPEPTLEEFQDFVQHQSDRLTNHRQQPQLIDANFG